MFKQSQRAEIDWHKRPLHAIGRLLFGIGLLAVAGLALYYIATVSGHFYNYGRFHHGDSELAILVGSTLGDKLGAINIQEGEIDVDIVFNPNEWKTFIDLWNKARKANSQSWRKIGDIQETETFNSSLLSLSAGPGVRFSLLQDRECLIFQLSPADYERFEQAVENVKKHLDIGTVNGIDMGTIGIKRGFEIATNSLIDSSNKPHPCKIED